MASWPSLTGISTARNPRYDLSNWEQINPRKMNFRLFTFLILSITTLLVTGDLSAQEKTKEASKAKEVQSAEQADKNAAKKQTAEKGDSKAAQVAKANEGKGCVLGDLEMKDILGNKVDLKKYQGKVVLIVNVASKCGFTGQYRPLQALHKRYKDHGFEIIAFPCNQFGKQEPKDGKAIDEFCKKKFGIEFDLYAKVQVKGKKQVELFKRLTDCNLAPAGKGAIHWNFEKFLIGKDGKPIARFRSNVSPDDERIVSRLEAALGIEDGKLKDGKRKGDKKEKAEPAKKETNSADQNAEKKTASEGKQDKKR